MNQIVVVVHMVLLKGKTDEAIAAFTPAIRSTHDEPGCQLCALHRDVHDPDLLVLIEQWDSPEAHEYHLDQPYVEAVTEAVAPMLAELPRISISEALPIGESHKSLL